MPSLFIANTSKKHNDFRFRIPGNIKEFNITIPAGTQAEVLKNAQQEDIDAVVKQHEPYGLIPESETNKICKFAGTLYSIGKPVSSSAMQLTIDKNMDIIDEESYEIRKQAAVALDASLSNALMESSRNGADAKKQMEIEIQEIPDESSEKRKMRKERIKVKKDE